MRVEDLRLIPGSAKAVAALNAAGHATAVVTNQSCVGRGLLSLQGLAGIHARLHELLAAEGALARDRLKKPSRLSPPADNAVVMRLRCSRLIVRPLRYPPRRPGGLPPVR